jgi:UDP:flavonoid glycosyltransferase YjiC (YdhE family)
VKIFYGICGEGMGHAGRSMALIERLVAMGHRVTIFTFADALQLLARSGSHAHELDGLRFATNSKGATTSTSSVARSAATSRSTCKCTAD